MALNNQKMAPSQAAGDSDAAEVIKQIHVMPQRFYVSPKKKNVGLIIIVLVGVLLIAGLVAIAVYLNQSLGKAQVQAPAINETNANANVDTNLNENANVNVEINANQNANFDIAVPIATNTPEISTTSPAVNDNVDTSVNTNVAPIVNPASQPLPTAYDEDGDKLTALEEALYGTDPKNSDSDKDRFTDGDELLNGYDPLRGNRATLANSGLISSYTGNLFSIMYPKKWRIKEQSLDKSEVLFVAGNGEFVEVLVVDNPNKFDLETWYKDSYPTSDFSALIPVTIGTINGLYSSDGLTYYFLSKDQNRVYLINCNIGDSTILNFSTTFTVMVKSFKMLE